MKLPIIRIRSLVDELSSRVEMTRIEYSEYEDRSVEFTQSEPQRKIDLRRQNNNIKQRTEPPGSAI